MSMATPSAPPHDLLRLAPAAHRRATLSHHSLDESFPLLNDFAMTEKAFLAMHLSPEDILT
jgi:hypothetical protein